MIDWRKASDHEVREALDRWAREQQWGPVPVAEERGEAIALAHDASNDAAVGRARLAAMAPDDPARERLGERVHADDVMAEQALGFAASLDDAHAAREAWWEHSRDVRDVREAAYGAEVEFVRRSLERYDEPDPQPAPSLPTDRGEQPETTLEAAPAAETVGHDAEPNAEPVVERGEQQALDLEVGAEQPEADGAVSAEQVPAAEQVPNAERHQQFLDRLAVEHQQALDELDPAGQMNPEIREARGGRATSSSSSPSCAPSTAPGSTPTSSSPTSTSPTPKVASSPKRPP